MLASTANVAFLGGTLTVGHTRAHLPSLIKHCRGVAALPVSFSFHCHCHNPLTGFEVSFSLLDCMPPGDDTNSEPPPGRNSTSLPIHPRVRDGDLASPGRVPLFFLLRVDASLASIPPGQAWFFS